MLENFIREISNMNFSFTTQDEITELHPKIGSNMDKFVSNRWIAYLKLEAAVNELDFDEIRSFCHNQLGVAACYNCYKLEEICKYIQPFAREDNLAPIQDVMPVLKLYLEELKVEISQLK